jgi:hypothetical protein
MARRFLSLESILESGRLSLFFRWSPCAISLVDAGSLLTCRKRNMLSGLRCEGRGMGFRARRSALISTVILATFLGFSGTFFRIPGLYRQANTRPASRPPSDWPGSPRGERREAGRPGPPPFSFLVSTILTNQEDVPKAVARRDYLPVEGSQIHLSSRNCKPEAFR